MKIYYVIGDATRPVGDGIKIIPHITNNIGAWGSGFVIALSKRWNYPEHFYRARQNYPLGHADILKVEEDIYVANMIGQEGIRPTHMGSYGAKGNVQMPDIPPIRYEAVRTALKKVNAVAVEKNATLHAPMFGTGLAGGKWTVIEKIIDEVITVPITIYVLNEKDLPQKVVYI